MAVLSPQGTSEAGGAVTPVAATVADIYLNSGREVVEITNGSAGAITVTIPAYALCTYGVAANAIHNKGGSVPAGATRRFGPYSSNYNDADGFVHVNLSAAASVTVAVVRH
jgi:hypothetical protein